MPPLTQKQLDVMYGKLESEIAEAVNNLMSYIDKRITEVQNEMRIPRDEIPENLLVPDGSYICSVTELERIATKGGANSKLPAGCKMFHLSAKVVDPKTYAGAVLNDYFVIGNEDDPEANDPETWKRSFGAMSLEALLKATKVQSDDEDAILIEIEGQQFLVDVSLQTDDGKRNPEFKGRQRNTINRYYPVGEKAASVSTAAKPAGRAAAPPPRRATPQADPAPAGNGAETEPTPKSPPPPAARGKAPTAGKVESIECTFCNPHAPVPRSDYKAHIEMHKAQLSGAIPEE